MSDVFDENEVVKDKVEVVEETNNEIVDERREKPKKEKKPRRPMTDEEKAIRVENLKKGREKALEKRRQTALLKQIEKQEKEAVIDEKIKKHIEAKDGSSDIKFQIYSLKDEISELKNLLKQKQAEPKVEVKPEPIKPAPSKPIQIKKQEPIKPVVVPKIIMGNFTQALW